MNTINNIPQRNPLTREELRWFSFIAEKAKQLSYGTIEMSLTVKNGQIVALRNITAIESFNVNG